MVGSQWWNSGSTNKTPVNIQQWPKIYEEIDYHLDKYRILQSTAVQKQLIARGRLVAPKFGTIPYAAHAFSLRGIEPIIDKKSTNLRKILQRHLIQMESLCLTEEAMKTAMTFFLQGKPQDVFDQHYHKRLQSICSIALLVIYVHSVLPPCYPTTCFTKPRYLS